MIVLSASSLDPLGFRVYTIPLRGRQEPLFFYDPLEDTEIRYYNILQRRWARQIAPNITLIESSAKDIKVLL